jgi:hypothetical protein
MVADAASRSRGSVPRPIQVHGQVDQPDWHDISLSQGTSLTEEWQTLPIEFHAKNLAATNALHYIVEDRPGTVWIADVSVTTKKGQ